METPPNLQVYDPGHLGLVASVLDRIRLVQTVNRLVGPRPGEKVSTGMALKAAILNVLGEWALRRGLAGTGSSLPEEGQAYPETHPALGVPALPLGASGLAGRPTPGPQPGPPSRERGAPAGDRAILPPGVRGVRNVGLHWASPVTGGPFYRDSSAPRKSRYEGIPLGKRGCGRLLGRGGPSRGGSCA